MNDIFKRPGKVADLPPGDPLHKTYMYARNEWDSRIMDAASSARAWRQFGLMLTGVLALSVAGNIYQSSQTRIIPYVVEEDSLGNAIAAKMADQRRDLTPKEITAALKGWIWNTRTVGVDVGYLKKSILDAYRLVEVGSEAKRELDKFYQTNDPFKRAQVETVRVTDMSAIPLGSGEDQKGLSTWRVEWKETTTTRDGTVVGKEVRWIASITFRHTEPKTTAEIEVNPNGIYIVAYTVTRP